MSSGNIIIADRSELQKQTAYAKNLVEKGFDFGFAVGTAFVESMRNTHYNNTGTALDELLDNSIEAGATEIHIALGYDRKATSKPDALAVIDNGHGMVPEMIRLAAAWGGTHRQGERNGFGRFGFGLPSASVNQARRFTIFSLIEGGTWHAVTIDLDDIAAGKNTDRSGKVQVPSVQQVNPPKWVWDYLGKTQIEHGTIVVWEKLDRTSWSTASNLAKNLLQHFGVIYRNYLSQVKLVFDGTPVEPLDPLFITPGYRYYDVDEDRASALEPIEFDVKSKRSDNRGKIRIRYARFPLSFFSIDKAQAASRKNANPRFNVAVDNRGLIISRMGRQIAVIERTPWDHLEKFSNNDRYWAAEIDFSAELDEEFTIDNTKQGVVLSERIWDLLRDAGVEAALRSLKRSVATDQDDRKAQKDTDGQAQRVSELSMRESEKFRRERASSNPVEREKKAKEALEQQVKRTSRETKRPENVVRKELEEDAVLHPYKVVFAKHPGAPFYRVEQIGGQKVLEINQSHRFFSDVYAADGANRVVRAGLEVLLFSLGESELDAAGNSDKTSFYTVEKAAWSERLAVALDVLDKFVHHTEVGELDDDAA